MVDGLHHQFGVDLGADFPCLALDGAQWPARFQRSKLTDAQDVALRGFVAWKRLNHRLMAEAQALESGTDRSGQKPRK
jgi:hypothetical protein